MSAPDHARVVIIGGGPGGLAAAIYAARAGLKPVCLLGIQTSSQLLTTTHVENYPGFKQIMGPKLIENMAEQAEHCGALMLYEDALEVNVKERPFKIKHGYEDHVITCDSLIFATGSQALRLDCKGEKEYWMKGVSACAICDGMMAKGKTAVVVGGGDVACEEATYLAGLAEKVYQILRRDQFRASKAMVDRVKNNSKIEIIYDSTVEEIGGEDRVSFIKIKNVKSGQITELKTNCLFWCVGHKPATDLIKGQVELDDTGYVILKKQPTTECSVEGVFIAGDCCDKIYRQAVVAAGSGAKAALDCERYLARIGK